MWRERGRGGMFGMKWGYHQSISIYVKVVRKLPFSPS